MIVEDALAVVACPRCGRFGVVRRDGAELLVEWADPRSDRGRNARPWVDTGVDGVELTDLTWGCGYDGGLTSYGGPR